MFTILRVYRQLKRKTTRARRVVREVSLPNNALLRRQFIAHFPRERGFVVELGN